jgi:hypothetical protein
MRDHRRNGGTAARRYALPLLSLLPFLFACELTEVTIPEGEPIVVVHAVLSARRSDQFVVVERSLTGGATGSAPTSIPPDEPRLPIGGATVTLAHEGPSACAGRTDTLRQTAAGSGIYRTSFCPLEPEDVVRLRVATPEGEVVTGSTTIPGARAVSVRLATDSARSEGQVLQLDRQRDTIRIGVDAILARALQVEVRWREEPDSLVFYLPTDTLGVAIPADLFNPFAGDSGKPVFEVGREYALGVAVTDSNYYDFVRSRSDPFTGRGFLNRLDGGIGVFGSVATYRYYLRVVR